MAIKFDKSTAIGTLSLTPLIDIVFLLLIFFLVATEFAKEEREMKVVLPAASEAKPLTAINTGPSVVCKASSCSARSGVSGRVRISSSPFVA